MFEEAGVENIRYENDIMSMAGLMPIQLKQSESMMKLLKAGLEKTGKDLSNLTLTTALRAQSSYYNAVNLAYMQVSSGVLSYQEAVKRAILSTAKEGSSVLYPSGHTDKIDVAIRRSVLTGVNQTAAQMSLSYCEEAGCDFVETTAHSGARPSHEAWQGKVFCISGNSSEYPPFSETGYGTGAGLCGWNCRHSFHAFFPGISVPAYTKEMLEDYRAKKYEYDGQKLTDYECSQIQRSYEREIRETRRQLTACDAAMKETDDEVLKASLQMEFEDKAVQLKEQECQLKEFCKKTNRRVDSSRLQVHAVRDGKGRIIGFNKSVSQKAVYENKNIIRQKTREAVVKSKDSGIIKSKRFNTKNDPMRDLFGAAEISNPKELQQIVDDLNRAGVEIIRREKAMGYSPALRPGYPGQFIIEEGASYSAWCHEYKHFCDDRDDGYLGFRVFQDSEKCIKREMDAYQIEINLARKARKSDVIEKLIKLRDKEIAKYE